MGRQVNARFGVAAVLAVSAVTVSIAQDVAEPTRNFALTLNQTFSATDNRAREPESAGVTSESITRLGFSAETLNPLNQLDFSASTALRFADRPEEETISEIDNPRLRLGYIRSGATSTLAVSGTFRRDDIEFLRPLEDFVNEEGELEIPDDIDDLDATGTRTSYSSNASLTLLRDAPVSLTFSLGLSGREYTDVSDPDLFDTQTTRYGVSAGFRFAPEFDGRLSFNQSSFSAEDEEQTNRDRQTVTFRLDRALSNVLTGRASIGQTVIDTDTVNGSTRSRGTNGSLGLSLDRPNGDIDLNLSTNFNVTGDRQNLDLQRRLVLPSGALRVRLGLTRVDQGGVNPTAGLGYNQSLPNGRLNLSFNRSVRFVEEDGTDQEFTSASASHTYDINAISSLTLRGALSQTDETDQATVSVSYNYALTDDWNLSSGYSFSTLDEDSDGRAETHRIFVGLSRRFDLPF